MCEMCTTDHKKVMNHLKTMATSLIHSDLSKDEMYCLLVNLVVNVAINTEEDPKRYIEGFKQELDNLYEMIISTAKGKETLEKIKQARMNAYATYN